ncbi:MAG TPA: M28 family metallopeptidase, partial [Thermoleophilaceae bacterium]|nr:M28 family metallopeptidase [Thermoleophilaceae bacterium]
MRFLAAVLVLTVVVGAGFVVLALTDNVPGVGELAEEAPSGPVAGHGGTDRFDSEAAFSFLERQVELGPRPAGSEASRKLAEWLRAGLPNGRFQEVPGGLRNVVGEVPGRNPERYLVVGAHYDTKDLPGFVGANDGASGTAVVLELARTVEPRSLEPTDMFVLFDGEESPAGTPDDRFAEEGLRGSRVAAAAFGDAQAMINVDFVGERGLRIPREENSDPELWFELREAAKRTGYGEVFPPATQPGILDDHIPFAERGIPAIDLIDFDFGCFHRACDDLDVVSARSLDAAGETVLELLRTFDAGSPEV